MTDVRFYHNVDKPVLRLCELLREAYFAGCKAVVATPDTLWAQRLDQQLWVTPVDAFIPHAMCLSPLAADSPIIIGVAGEVNWPHNELLFNYSGSVPAGCANFRTIIEIVGNTEAERGPARERWKYYKQQKFDLVAIDDSQNRRI